MNHIVIYTHSLPDQPTHQVCICVHGRAALALAGHYKSARKGSCCPSVTQQSDLYNPRASNKLTKQYESIGQCQRGETSVCVVAQNDRTPADGWEDGTAADACIFEFSYCQAWSGGRVMMSTSSTMRPLRYRLRALGVLKRF